MNVKIHIVFRVIVGLYAAAVGFLCFADFDPAFIQEQSQLLHLTDKDVHFLMFLPFVPLMYLAFASYRWNFGKTALFSAAMLVTAAAVASMIELIQGQTEYRGEDLWDAVAGIAGAAIGMVALLVVKAVILRRGRACPKDRCSSGERTSESAGPKNGGPKNCSGGTAAAKVKGAGMMAAVTLASAFLLSMTAAPETAAQNRSEFRECCDSLTARLQRRTGVRSDDLKLRKVLRRGRQIDFYFEQTLGDYPWHEGDVEWFRKELKSCFPKKYSGRTVGEVFSKRSPLKDFVTPELTYDGVPAKSLNRVSDPAARETDIVRKVGAMEFSKGLEHRNIALWQSHGYYYEQSLDRWEWQRACLFQTVEDMFTQSFVLPFLVPMLENAGAYVMLPRERDLNSAEYIIDNDLAETSRTKGSFRAEGDWKIAGPGFADRTETIRDGDNPFFAGTFLSAECGKKSKKGTMPKVLWRPEIAREGEYAVYVAYRSLPESTESAHYTVRHLGGSSEFLVNQRIGGGTWIYLGTFPFGKGKDGCVILDGGASGSKGVVCADAVRFGGGMGNVARGGSADGGTAATGESAQVTAGENAQPDGEVSGMPRFAEAARYSLQWYGAPERVWSQNEGKSDYRDDYMCRGIWTDWLSGGARMNRKADGLGIPIDLCFAFHTDAGTAARDTTIGTLAIYTSVSEGKTELPSGERRITSREYADIVQSQIVADIRATYDQDWTRRGTKDRSYLESRTPAAPSMILELLSHQNFNDMKFGLDPAFRFLVSRSAYKGMLKYLSNRYGCPYAVQPLPVRSFATELGDVGDNGYSVTISWCPREDRLEPTAKPKGYILSTRIDDGVFDDGMVMKNTKAAADGRISYSLKLEKGHVYSFRVTAFNDGGKSFPSETLSVGLPKGNNAGNVMIVNNFTRVAAPSWIDTPEYAGFDSRNGGGVDYGRRINYVGEMYQFRRDLQWRDDDAPGFGASWTDMAASLPAGNSFDYPAVHGREFMKLGHGFVSMSSEAFEALGANDPGTDGIGTGNGDGTTAITAGSRIQVLDLICGKQGTTPRGTGKAEPMFGVFPEGLQQRLREFTEGGGCLIVSGANIGTDLGEGIYQDCVGTGAEFAAQVLGFRPMNGHGSRCGEYRWTSDGRRGATGKFYNTPNTRSYSVETPDGIVPANTAGKTFLRYSDTGISAGVAYDGGCYRTVCVGFPIETVADENEMKNILEYCLEFFSR